MRFHSARDKEPRSKSPDTRSGRRTIRLLTKVFVTGAACLLLPFGNYMPQAAADLVRLRGGGEIRGKILSGGHRSDPTLKIQTLHGAEVTVKRDQIAFYTRRPLKVEEYETRARRVANTVEAQWQLAEWCREQNLDRQRQTHLQQIVELDPDHELAHRGLGHTFEDGQWMSREERMTAQGYVKYKGRYITPQELELIQKNDAEREREQAWFQRVRLWKGWVTGRHPERRQEGLQELQKLSDPDAVPALVKFFSDDRNPVVRRLMVDVLKRCGGAKPVAPLVRQSLRDVDATIRYEALNAIEPDQYDVAMPLFVAELRNKLNVIVERAAIGLQRVGDDRVVPALMDALVTAHFYRVPVRRNNTVSMRTDGNIGGTNALTPELQALLASGQYNGAIINQHTPGPRLPPASKFVTVKYEHRNQQVLDALTKLTGENFGFDERSWKLWLAASKNGVVAKP